MHKFKRWGILLTLFLIFLIETAVADIIVYASEHPVKKSGWYQTMEEVAVYLTQYKSLPDNYLTKQEAERLGWNASAGNLWSVANGKSIGGNRYGNYEGLLPVSRGRTWTECDIDYNGKRRNSKRIVFSNDGLIYYTSDHYSSFDEVIVVEDAGKPTPTNKPKATKTPTPSTPQVLYTNKKPLYLETYTDWENVAAYLLEYGELPINYISLEDAKSLGYSSKRDNMGEVAPEFTIGGGHFQNREGILPVKDGREWYECDVDTVDGKRGSHRLLYSNDGLCYLTTDKYKTATQVEVAK